MKPLFLLLVFVSSLFADTASFDCSSVRPGSIEDTICNNEELTQLDSRLSRVYKEALKVESKTVDPVLTAEQRGWIKGRNECWKSADKVKCVGNSYQRRIAELQAKYRLLSPVKTVAYFCNNQQANELFVNYFETTPAALIAERGDKSFLMIQGEDDTYTGRNEKLVPSGEEIKAKFSFEGPELNCQPYSTKMTSKMHSSWDLDKDGLNDCEKDGSCDHAVDYTKPRK